MSKKEKPTRERYDDLIDRKKHPFRWFAQVAWYRNWIFIIGGVILAAILSVLVFQSLTTERYDMRFVMAYYDTMITTPVVNTVEGEIQKIYPDVDGNGKTVVGADLLNLGDSASVEVNEAYWRKMLTSFSDETYVMYILDRRLMELYSGNENGETPFDTACIEMYTGKKELFLSLEDSPYFRDSGYQGDSALYVAFRTKPSSVRASDEIFYKDYVNILRMLLPEMEAKGQG